MKPPVLQTRWFNQPSFEPTGRSEHVESFFLRLVDPQGRRALWIRLSCTGGKTERFGEAFGAYVDLTTDTTYSGKNRVPAERVNVDPERGGLGVGESAIEESASYGIIRGDGFMLTWSLKMKPEMPAYLPFPSERLYRGSWLKTKWVSPSPCSRVSGRIELWTNMTKDGEHTRDSELQVIEVNDWLGMQGHNWGDSFPPRYAWTHCNQLEGAPSPSFFEAFSADMKVAGILGPMTVGRLVMGEQVYRFDTWRTVRTAQSAYGPTQWKFELQGPEGVISGTVNARQGHTLSLELANPSRAATNATLTPFADMTLELKPNEGERRVLQSTSAVLEVGQ